MTEFEAKKELTELANNDKRIYAEEHEALEKAIYALEEIEEYRAIGTVEEFKALKEKATAIKIKHFKKAGQILHYCGACGRDILSDIEQYCPVCGQKLDWSE